MICHTMICKVLESKRSNIKSLFFSPRGESSNTVADDFIQRPMYPRSTGYDDDGDDDDVARVVAFVLSLQRLHSARFNILTKIPGATGGRGPGIRAVSVPWNVARGKGWKDGEEGGGGGSQGCNRAKLSRRAATGTLARRAATEDGRTEDAHPGTKVSRADVAPMSPRLR